MRARNFWCTDNGNCVSTDTFASGFLGDIGFVIATTVICCLVFSIVESQLILPAHLGHSHIKTPEKEVGLMLIPIVLILIIAVSENFRQILALSVFGTSCFLALYLSGNFSKLANYAIQKQSLFANNFEFFVNTRFRSVSEKALVKDIAPSLGQCSLLSLRWLC